MIAWAISKVYLATKEKKLIDGVILIEGAKRQIVNKRWIGRDSSVGDLTIDIYN